MICFNCGYKLNSPDAEQCRVCGVKFSFMCRSCGSPNPKLARFCLNCGADISVGDIKPVVSERLSENRKSVAVVFADISRFTSISENLDPEEARKIINDCFRYITKPVYELEGTIDKYMGDCVMILFGARYTHNDDSMRAVKCAMRMMKRIDEFSLENEGRLGTKLGLSIGINYGLVVTGKVGNYYDDDYTVMGDVVNTAQRLQTVAGRGNILVSKTVFDETNDFFHYSDKREVNVRNKEKPVECYSPISLIVKKSSESEELVPRLDELDFLNMAYERRDDLNHVTVSGESGLGKTTLVKTFLAENSEDNKQLWINCNSVLKERPYSTISSVISAILNIDPNDTNRIKTNRLKSFLDYIMKDSSEETIIRNYNFLALIMGLDRDNDYTEIINAMDYDDLQREIVFQVSTFFGNLDKRQNFIIVIDDMHLSDNESLAVLPALGHFSGFFVFVTQFTETTEDGNVLELQRFTKEETEKLISLMSGTESADEGFIDGIFDITDGNPMFIHEIMQTVIKKGLYYRKGNKAFLRENALESLPRNLRNTILRNISELDEGSMKFLRIASVIGSQFNISWVLDEMEEAEKDQDVMRLPVKLNIIEFTTIQKTTESTDKIYSFTQDTIRKVIYDSMLNEQKREYHGRIAERIERKYKKEIENYYEVLGYHYSNSKMERMARQYYLKSADKLKQNYIFKSALEYYDKYIALESVSENPSENISLVEAMISKGEILLNTSEYDKALQCLSEAGELAVHGEIINRIKLMKATALKETARYEEALGILDQVEPMLGVKSNLFGKALQLRCAIYIVLGKPGVIDLVKKSEEILQKTRDYSSLAEAMSHAGIKHFFTGNPGDAIEYFQKALDYAQRSNNQGVISKVSINLGIIYHATGEIDKSFVYLSNSMDASEKISNIKSYLSAEINLGIFYMEKGLLGKAVTMFDDAIARSRERELYYQTCLALLNKADVEYEIGNYGISMNLYTESLDMAQKYNMTVEVGLNYLGLAKTKISMETYEDVSDYLEKAYRVFDEAGEMPSIGDYHYYKAIYHYDKGDYRKALGEIEKAIAISVKINEEVKLTRYTRKKGDILMKYSGSADAMPEYDRCVELSENTGSFYEMAKSYFLRYRMYDSMNETEKASADLGKAKQFIKEIDFCKWTSSILNEGRE